VEIELFEEITEIKDKIDYLTDTCEDLRCEMEKLAKVIKSLEDRVINLEENKNV
jgi:predicted  nucleic acid-binding Zn-ribbon protein